TEFMPNLAPEDSDRMQELVAERSIAVTVDEGMSYGTLRLNNLSSEQLWNILLYTGYLTLDEHCDNGINRLRIPNREVLKCFRDNISKYYEGKGESPYGILARNLIGQLFSCDSDNAAESLQSLLAGFVSLRDNATRAPHENFYHGFLDGLFAAAGDDIRDYKSQAESGSGYADITFKSRSRTEAVVIEIKYAKDSSTDLTALANSALAQIEEKGYAKSLLCNPKIKRVVECGIAFHGRDCDVSCGELLP
ncbi:MAG: PD-(D/E)XK nuclease domain-containing protein, partial [Succinivibrionaceae bacterium]|nr:PD-(D/E)XK nuclease domain-containing protein [Succinivibrionaceae bacterium]